MHVFAAYGMSETCPVLTATRFKAGASDGSGTHPQGLRKAGLPIPLVDLRVVDENMQELARDGTSAGEIAVRAPWLTMGYCGDALASEGLWHGGYLHTRDVGTIDAQGCLEVRDRLKDVIKSGGEWICSLQLRELISRHPAVAEVAVIAVPDETWGERPLALVVARPEHRHHLAEADIRTHLEQLARDGLIARYAIPQRTRFVDALERTSVGKVNKQLMRERFAPLSVSKVSPCN
jgi:fatty-acyl-CoA synthase